MASFSDGIGFLKISLARLRCRFLLCAGACLKMRHIPFLDSSCMSSNNSSSLYNVFFIFMWPN